jgi:hypothetical protein
MQSNIHEHITVNNSKTSSSKFYSFYLFDGHNRARIALKQPQP